MYLNAFNNKFILILYINMFSICLAGNLEEEEKVLKWLENQQKTDEIEDITDEMLDMIIEKMAHVAVLFCEL